MLGCYDDGRRVVDLIMHVRLESGKILPAARVPRRRSGLRLRLQIALFVLDVSIVTLTLIAVGFFWSDNHLGKHCLLIIAAFMPCYAVASINGGALASAILVRRRKSVILGMRAIVISFACVILGAFFLKGGDELSRMTLLVGGAVGCLGVGAARIGFQTWSIWRFGAELHCKILVLDDCQMPAEPGVFQINAAAYDLRCDLSDPLMLHKIGEVLSAADRVVIACQPERRRAWAMVLKGAHIQAEIVIPEITDLGPLGSGWYGERATLVIATGPFNLRERFLKRALDLSLVLFALLLLFPLLALVALAVKLDSPGPILFVQKRVGRSNRQFGIYKFRSMRAESSDGDGARSASRGDDRVTRVGRVIRATSIDELPQLFNIVKGQMSFVGPRPHALGSLAGDRLFWEIDERYWHRHACKPGITGLAQVRGFRGATHNRVDLVNRLQADLEYHSGWTIWRDVSILLATVRVIMHRNAY